MPRRARLNSLSDDSLISLALPADQLISQTALENYVEEDRRLWWSDAVLSLSPYFHCQQAMHRSEQVILRAYLPDCDSARF